MEEDDKIKELLKGEGRLFWVSVSCCKIPAFFEDIIGDFFILKNLYGDLQIYPKESIYHIEELSDSDIAWFKSVTELHLESKKLGFEMMRLEAISEREEKRERIEFLKKQLAEKKVD